MIDYEEELRKSQERRMERGEPVGEPVVEPGPAGRLLGDERASAARPFVGQLREDLFGSPDAPFQSEDDPDYHEWDTAHFREDSEERDRLYGAVELLSKATGFREMDVRDWILFGKTPPLPRAVVHAGDRKTELPDGTILKRRYATLTLHAPVTDEEIRSIYRERLRPIWDATLAVDALHGRQRGSEVTDLDYHLDQLVQRMPDATWKQRLQEWKETPLEGMTKREWLATDGKYGRVTAAALRVRYHRLQKKKDELTPGSGQEG